MDLKASGQEHPLSRILETVRLYWGFDRLRPLQEEAIRAGLDHRDSLVVLPTGGGKSLCYQVPPLLVERTDIVISPLISLMKDQLDALQACGYPAAALHSGMTSQQRRQGESFIASGKCRLVLVAPERLVTPWFLNLIQRRSIRAFAVDEAHCISHWGHDFRPEYRQLAVLKECFPDASIQAYTATATQRVRQDIIEQLRLKDPAVLVGCFDRPNLIYRLVPRQDVRTQVRQVIDRHPNQAVIVYCISRSDTQSLAAHLQSRGVRAAYYHAGMKADERRKTQDAFSNEQLDVIVATVAFGMGIDRSDVRCVIHAAMPKSIEHYQQETGRAGRDGLEAECILFYSPADVLRWKSLLEKTAEQARNRQEVLKASVELLQQIRRYCAPGRCRHKALSEYFGQTYQDVNCNACDICLNECGELEEGTVSAQMILSCVGRVGQRFGIGHVVDVLCGADTERMKSVRHHELSTYGLMKTTAKKVLTNMVYQLVDQDLLTRTNGEYPVLRLNKASWQVLRGQRKVWLVPPKTGKVKKTAHEKESWEGVDGDLFESLRRLRTQMARERSVPPYVIFSDAALREMARRRPLTGPGFLSIHGVGEKKLSDFGDIFMAHIRAHE
ncbi:DNA helicase RecQ, partial [Acidobacteria bacterium AH-259-G07]|nr:DNA helicase RecQ [Acidobacteria bacterium AH-259-G07]